MLSLDFAALLAQLGAAHERVAAENAELRSENAALRARSFSLYAELQEYHEVPVERSPTDAHVASADVVVQVASKPLKLVTDQPLSSGRCVADIGGEVSLHPPTVPVSSQCSDEGCFSEELPPEAQPEPQPEPQQQRPCVGDPPQLPPRRAAEPSGSFFSSEPVLLPKAIANDKKDQPVVPDYLKRMQLWNVWLEGPLMSPSVTKSSIASSASASFLYQTTDIRGGDVLLADGMLQKLVTGPNSKRRIIWDLASIVVVTFDVLTVPLVAFRGMESDEFKHISLATTIFWTIDIPFTFLSGFHSAGVVELRPSQICRNYIRTWFFVDAFIVLLDWLLFFVQSGLAELIGIVRISKTLRLSRILRLFRLLRVIKFPNLVDGVSDYLQSESLLTAFGILKSMIVIAIVNHFIACGWYAVGNLGYDPQWTKVLEDERRDLGYTYLTSLHWSLTQFTPASMEVVPRNAPERLFSIVVLFSALVTFSSFVSSITTAMTNLRTINLQRSKQRDNIRRYIADNRISLELGNRITAFLRSHNFMAKKRVHENEIQVFKALPETLKMQLHWEVFMPCLAPHPLFHHFNESDEAGLLEICHHAMGELSLATVQELFVYEQQASLVYFKLSGILEYFHGVNEVGPTDVGNVDWFVEVVLWLKWDHHGRVTAVTPCEFVTIDAGRFRKSVSRRWLMLAPCRQYAKQYRQYVVDQGPDHPVDVDCDFDLTQEMVQRAFEEFPGQSASPAIENDSSPRKFLRMWRTWTPPGLRMPEIVREIRKRIARHNTV